VPTDYVLFIHGVSTRQPTYADKLINSINQTTPIQPLVVFWGDVTGREEDELLNEYEASDIWSKLWFIGIREQEVLPFVGDIALYLSRYIGARVAERVAAQVTKLKDASPEDRLHLVTHSLGTVILFDILFSSRWDDEDAPGHKYVMAIRDAIYGVTGDTHDPKHGIRLGSITTMGSPIGIFSLIDVDPPSEDIKSDPSQATSTHDISPSLVRLLAYLHDALGGKKLPWSNFVHPGDGIASPLIGVLVHLIDGEKKYLAVRDILVPLAKLFKDPLSAVLLDRIGWLFRKSVVSAFDTGNAHRSYWRSTRVARGITHLIRQARDS
jgi:hypothetical protein